MVFGLLLLRAVATGGGSPSNNLLITILFWKSYRPYHLNNIPLKYWQLINFKRLHYPWQTAKNHITHTFLQLLQYIVKYTFAHFPDHQNSVKIPQSPGNGISETLNLKISSDLRPSFSLQSKRPSYGYACP